MLGFHQGIEEEQILQLIQSYERSVSHQNGFFTTVIKEVKNE